ncbi:aldehyde reductase 1 [Blastocladiella britannica]|nr:aldehyde reductase 1 [Blastocladiella britannica]
MLKLASGRFMPQIGLGAAGASSPQSLTAAVEAALDAGYRHIDTAWVYENSEQAVGTALANWIAREPFARCRSDVFITTKLWSIFARPDRVEYAVRQSLARMQLEYVDLVLIHWPMALRHTGNDADTNPTELVPGDGQQQQRRSKVDAGVTLSDTWRALESLVDKGLVKYIGLSNVTESMIQTVHAGARVPIAVVQNEMHPYLPQERLLQQCRDHGIVMVGYSPLGSPSSRFRSAAAPNLMADPTILAIAAAHGCSPARILISWAVMRGTAVIPKSESPERLRANLVTIPLTEADMAAIASLGKSPYRYFDPREMFGLNLFDE